MTFGIRRVDSINGAQSSCDFHTLGGLKIDAKAEVVNLNGEVIPGLYAAGRSLCGFFGVYPGSGRSIDDGLTFGRKVKRPPISRRREMGGLLVCWPKNQARCWHSPLRRSVFWTVGVAHFEMSCTVTLLNRSPNPNEALRAIPPGAPAAQRMQLFGEDYLACMTV